MGVSLHGGTEFPQFEGFRVRDASKHSKSCIKRWTGMPFGQNEAVAIQVCICWDTVLDFMGVKICQHIRRRKAATGMTGAGGMDSCYRVSADHQRSVLKCIRIQAGKRLYVRSSHESFKSLLKFRNALFVPVTHLSGGGKGGDLCV